MLDEVPSIFSAIERKGGLIRIHVEVALGRNKDLDGEKAILNEVFLLLLCS